MRDPDEKCSPAEFAKGRRQARSDKRKCKMKTYNLFISHSWTYGNEYRRLVNLLDSRRYFRYRNYSVPKDDPVHNARTDKMLYNAILKKISPCSVVLILAGVYSTYSKWIDKEITICKREFLISKPIIAIEPWGSEKTSQVVKKNADRIVKWNKDSVVRAIRELR